MRVGEVATFVLYGRSGIGEKVLHVRCSCKMKCGHVLSSRVILAICQFTQSYYYVIVGALRNDLSAPRSALLEIRGQSRDRVQVLQGPRTLVREHGSIAVMFASHRAIL
jgi:hypothetical protein